MDFKSFQRAASHLMVNELSNDHEQQVLVNFIDSVFFSNGNSALTTSEISGWIKRETTFEFAHDEIEEVILSHDTEYKKFHNREENKFSLQEKRFQEIAENKEKTLEYYVTDFAEATSTDPSAFSETFFRFLYSVMTKNVTSLRTTLETKRLFAETIDDSFSESQAQLINRFLSIDNPQKNELIFRTVILGLEYYLCFSPENSELIEKVGLSDKEFLLDTNIVFRAIGLNGANRKNSVRQFLAKANSTGNHLFISVYTEKEFKQSLRYHCKQVSSFQHVTPSIFSEYSSEEDFYKSYYSWKERNRHLGADAFEAEVMLEYQKLRTDFSITTYAPVLSDQETEISSKIQDYSRQIEHFKRNLPNEGYSDFDIPDRSIFDARNIILVEKNRTLSTELKDNRLFVISTDQQLIEWDLKRSAHFPVIFLPSQWLVVLLRFHSRSDDDYKGFVGFINLSVKRRNLSNESLVAILEGIGQQTQDIQRQERILEIFTKNRIEKILTSRKVEKIIERAKHESESIERDELGRVLQEKGELVSRMSSLSQRERELQGRLLESEGQLTSAETRKDAYRNALVETVVKPKVFRHRLIGLVFLVGSFAVLAYYALFLFWSDANWNFVAKYVVPYLDSIGSDAKRSFLNGIVSWLPTALIPALWVLFYNFSLNEKRIAEFKAKVESRLFTVE